MKADFSRKTFNAQNHFSRVLMQQGRVQLDADWNEQASITLHYLQSLAKDLIGPYGGPGDGFKIVPNGDRDFKILSGHYYVDGILCENEADAIYSDQSDYPIDETGLTAGEGYLVYMDVWERHITYIQEESIREVALGGPDTATRAQIVWQVKVLPQENLDTMLSEVDMSPPADYCEIIYRNWEQIVQQLDGEYRGELKAKTDSSAKEIKDNFCVSSPESNYRGPENQLYRVEIHGSGRIDDGPTFKCSRDNGSVVYPIRSLAGNTVTVEHLGRDRHLGLKEGYWVEIVDDESVLKNEPYPLLQVDEIDAVELRVILSNEDNMALPVYEENSPKHPLLRRWDHQAGVEEHGGSELGTDGALKIREDDWIMLEDGVWIYFESAVAGETNTYRSGDYWLIPARTATGDIEWPKDEMKDPKALPPQGIHHHYAPLALITLDATTGEIHVGESADCRCTFQTLCDIAKLLEDFIGGSPSI
jgi:hypothetical protein